ncbi:MAG: bifunctional metallophosphatase/5'-nucleotidase [Solirubrobacteraceae bacterium]
MTSRVRAVLLAALALTLLAAGPAAAAGKPAFELTLLHNNDAESRLLTGSTVANYGGAGRFATVVDRLKAQADAPPRSPRDGTLMISSGDNFLAGLNLNASFEKGIPWYDSIAFNRFGYDAATIGNHEFDFGPDRLADFIEGTDPDVPFLSANLDVSGEPRLQALAEQGRIAPSTIVKRRGEKIGVIGLTTPLLPIISSPRDVEVSDDLADIVNTEARRLDRRRVDIVVLSSHLQGIDSERELVSQLRGVDAVIGGGGDELLAGPGDVLVPNGGDPARGFPTPFGQYPLFEEDATGNDVPIVTTAGNLLYVGRLTLQFDKRGELLDNAGGGVVDDLSGPVRVSGRQGDPDIAEPDAGLVATVEQPLIEYRNELANTPVATTEVPLDARVSNLRTRETGLGSLVADGFLYTVNREAAAEARPVADVAFSNGGGIRGDTLYLASATPAAPAIISEALTFDILPFDNLLVTVPNVSRAKFKELMEHGVARTPTADGRFPQIGGFSMVADPAAPAGSRIVSITLADGTPIVSGGVVVAGGPINVATTNFTAAGGDGYPFAGTETPVSSAIAYQQGLFRFLSAADGLNGLVTAADYPLAGDGRIDLTP